MKTRKERSSKKKETIKGRWKGMFSCEEIARTQIGVCRKYISKGLKSGNQTVAMHKDLKLNKYMYHTVNTIDDNQSNSYIKMD